MTNYSGKFKDYKFAEKVAILIGVPCIIISTYQTAVGWNYTTGLLVLSITLSFIASGMMFAMDLQMNHYKARGKFLRIALFLFIYMLFATFSFIGNFNAIYTEVIKDELFTRELNKAREYTKAFENGHLEVIDAQRDSVRDNVQRLSQELKSEVLTGTAGLRGCGPKCAGIISQFENYGVAEPRVPSMNLSPQAQAAQLEAEIRSNLSFRLQKYDEDNEEIKEQLKVLVDSSLAVFAGMDDIGFFDDKRAIYEDKFRVTSRLYNDMVAQLRGHIGRSLSAEFPEITFNPGDVGKWSFALSHARNSTDGNRLTTLVIVLVCLLIDLIVPIVIIVLVPVDKSLLIAEEKEAKNKEDDYKKHKRDLERSDLEDDDESPFKDSNHREEPREDPAFVQNWRSR